MSDKLNLIVAIDFVTNGKPMKKRKGNIFASRILHIPDIEQKLTSPLKNVITGFDCISESDQAFPSVYES